MKKSILSLLTALLLPVGLSAAPMDFDFEDPKGVNNIVFQLDAPLESTNGIGTGITGNASFDPEDPASISGKIVLATASLKVPNPRMQEHLMGDGWLNAEKNPEIVFETVSVSNTVTEENTTTGDLTGKLTLKGVTREITVPIKMTYLKGKLKERGGTKQEGDLLVLRSKFTILRDDFDIKAGKNLDKVSNEIELTLSIVGMSPD